MSGREVGGALFVANIQHPNTHAAKYCYHTIVKRMLYSSDFSWCWGGHCMVVNISMSMRAMPKLQTTYCHHC